MNNVVIKATDQQVEESASEKKKVGIKPSSSLMAIALFLLLNVSFFQLVKLPVSQFQYLYNGWIWWLVKDLRLATGQYNVATTGSSLVISAITNSDTNYLNVPIDVERHHSADYIDHKLSSAFGGNYKTINLATPGQMPSDAYLILRTLLKLGQHPNILIYGLAPRDFLDGTLSAASDTEPYRYLNRIVSVEDIADQVYSSWLGRLDHWLEQSIFLYKHSVDLHILFDNCLTRTINTFLPRPASEHLFTYRDRLHLLPAYKGNEIVAGEYKIMPLRNRPTGKWDIDNTADYIQRYRHPNPQMYKTQFYFLAKLEGLCRNEKIQLILVNMPLSTKNMSLLANSRYIQYLTDVKEMAQKQNLPLYDLNNHSIFINDLFNDPVHLNAYGGKILIDLLVDKWAYDPSVKNKFVISGTRNAIGN